MRWRLLLLLLLVGDHIAGAYRAWADENEWFERYVKHELEAGKRPWFYGSKFYW